VEAEKEIKGKARNYLFTKSDGVGKREGGKRRAEKKGTGPIF